MTGTRGGAKPGERRGGRKKGVKNKATLERQARAAADLAKIAELERLAEGAKDEVQRAAIAGKKLMKDIAFDFAALFASMAAYYQPQPVIVNGRVVSLEGNPNADEAKFDRYSVLAAQTSIQAAKYQSPSFSAMVVGASVTTKVVVEGGMPNDFDPPAPRGEILDLKPLTVITADEEPEAPAILPKAVGE
jgi:predicted NBD/HSP70 family sugar kinase